MVWPPQPRHRNYLRVRGEYGKSMPTPISAQELPPRARRIRHPCPIPANHRGTTSACAENTTGDTSDRSNNWNYLRVRGEYRPWRALAYRNSELPPRARRIHVQKCSNFLIGGTTSACAENTSQR